MTLDRANAMRGLWDQVLALTGDLTEDDWSRTVPWTPAWTVADLVSHLGGLQSSMNGAPQPPAPPGWSPPDTDNVFDLAMAEAVAARRDWTPQQRVEEVVTAADAHVAALAAVSDWSAPALAPAGPTTQEGLFLTRAFDLWVHVQDLRETLGQPVDVMDRSDGAAAAHAFVLRRLPWMLVKRVGAGEDATIRVALGPPADHDDVLHVVAGRAGWDADADPGDCHVTAEGGALTLLTSGRGDAQRWRDAGALSWGGRLGAAFVEHGRMF